MHVHTITTGQLDTNCYIVSCPDTAKCLIIDPGDGADVISDHILTSDLKPQTIIATHGHFDHILAVFELQTAFEIPFLIHKEDEKLVNKMQQSAKYWLQREIIEQPPEINDFLTNNQEIKFGNCKLAVLHSPGHTPGGICLYNSKQKIIFTGDTLFKNGVGRTDFSYCSKGDLFKSISKIQKKFKGYQAYPGHEEIFII